MLKAFAQQGQPAAGLFNFWQGPTRARAAFAAAFALAWAVTGLAVWLVAAAPRSGPIAPASHTLLVVLSLNLLLILALAGAVAARVAELVRRRSDPGARLHLRFVTLFGGAAAIPAVVVALIFGVLVTRGVESWFSKDVRTSVENGATIARDYLSDVSEGMTADLQAMSAELRQIRPMFANRLSFGNALTALAEFRGYAAVYLISGDGVLVASGETSRAPPYLAPPAAALKEVAAGQAPPAVTQGPDAVRALYPLPEYPGVYLYVVRPLRPGIVARLKNSSREIEAYRERERGRSRVQLAFGLAYAETALLVLVGAVSLGMTAAAQISSPVARLVQAADRVAGGDLSARVNSEGDPAEIAVLSRAFNRMTGDLQAQQEALKAASREAQERSRFTETVLSGVSAGVIGLDGDRRISAVNSQALRLLGLREADTIGRSLARAAPELAEVVAHAAEDGSEQDVDVTRGAEARRLRVRVSGARKGSLVLTFDDITRLMAAQRNAAWRDVARRIAHEIKNPLTPIQLSAERLQRKYRDQIKGDLETFDRCTDTIIRQVGDIGRMVDEFSAFARMPTPKFAHEDGAELLRQAVFAQRVAHPEIELELIGASGASPFIGDGRMVAQALTNVLKNAGEAVAARRLQTPEDGGLMRARLVETENSITFVIEDNGIGLPAKDRDRLTEPYVTTREKGTGLGLAIVKRICEEHDGELVLGDATELSGARVALCFPRLRKAGSESTAIAT